MARRRTPPEPVQEHPAAPIWIRQMNFGLTHFCRDGEDRMSTAVIRRWRNARDHWCQESGCHRTGKTCTELFASNTCGAGARQQAGR